MRGFYKEHQDNVGKIASIAEEGQEAQAALTDCPRDAQEKAALNKALKAQVRQEDTSDPAGIWVMCRYFKCTALTVEQRKLSRTLVASFKECIEKVLKEKE